MAKGKYVFKPYSKTYPGLFEREKKRIAARLPEVCIEHVGSTAVPGLGGKGIIDIAIAIPKKDLDSVSKQLQKLGYEFRSNGSAPDRLFFRIDLPDEEEEIRRYHVHLTHFESEDWKDFIAFRDYLRAHPEEAGLYAEAKKKAVDEAKEEGAAYRKLKGHIFKKILKK